MLYIVKEQPGRFYFYIVVSGIVFPFPGKIILILVGFLGFAGNWHITFRFRISGLYIICEQILGKEPGGQHFLRVFLIEDTYRRSL